MASRTIRQEVSGGSTLLTRTKAYTGTLAVSLDAETVADAQTDQQSVLSLDVSAVKSFYIVSSQAVTLETNSGSSPANTIALLADIPYIWTTDSYDTFLLTTDVTSFFFTNASGSTATIYMEAIIDSTP